MTTHEGPGIRAIAPDPDGVAIVLREERWGHIIANHPEVRPLQVSVMEAVSSPSHRRPGPSLGEVWFYLELPASAPAHWLKVVVRYDQREGWIVTAFLRRSMP